MSDLIQLVPARERTGVPAFERLVPVIRTDGVYVVFTTVEETLGAVRVAARLAQAMAAPLTVIHFRAVPYPLSIGAPAGVSPVETERFVGRLRAEGFDARVRVYLCRSERDAAAGAFKPHSLIVVAGRRSWWPTPAERWRRRLEAAGHFVVFVEEIDRVATPEPQERRHA
jgi:hypothetical protein